MPNHHIALGRVVHYVAGDYECPAMMVGTPRHFMDEEDVELQYQMERKEAITTKQVTLQVHHPFDIMVQEDDSQEITEVALITIVSNAPHRNGPRPQANTWHWADECMIGGRV
jgi:hypothetical protein